MYASDDCGAAILSAAQRVKVLALDLVCTPHDPTLIVPIFETALTITEVGQKLGLEELNYLSARLVAAAKRELGAADDLRQLDSVISRLTAIAEILGRERSAQLHTQHSEPDSVRPSLFRQLTHDRWPAGS